MSESEAVNPAGSLATIVRCDAGYAKIEIKKF